MCSIDKEAHPLLRSLRVLGIYKYIYIYIIYIYIYIIYIYIYIYIMCLRRVQGGSYPRMPNAGLF
jgi:hypothetical protein